MNVCGTEATDMEWYRLNTILRTDDSTQPYHSAPTKNYTTSMNKGTLFKGFPYFLHKYFITTYNT